MGLALSLGIFLELLSFWHYYLTWVNHKSTFHKKMEAAAWIGWKPIFSIARPMTVHVLHIYHNAFVLQSAQIHKGQILLLAYQFLKSRMHKAWISIMKKCLFWNVTCLLLRFQQNKDTLQINNIVPVKGSWPGSPGAKWVRQDWELASVLPILLPYNPSVGAGQHNVRYCFVVPKGDSAGGICWQHLISVPLHCAEHILDLMFITGQVDGDLILEEIHYSFSMNISIPGRICQNSFLQSGRVPVWNICHQRLMALDGFLMTLKITNSVLQTVSHGSLGDH